MIILFVYFCVVLPTLYFIIYAAVKNAIKDGKCPKDIEEENN